MNRGLMMAAAKKRASGGASFATLDPAHTHIDAVLSNGNLTMRPKDGAGNWTASRASKKAVGKFYVEFVLGSSGAYQMAGIVGADFSFAAGTGANVYLGSAATSGGHYRDNNGYANGMTTLGSFSTFYGTHLGMAVDADAGKAWFTHKNNLNSQIWTHSGNPETGANPYLTWTPNQDFYPAICCYADYSTTTCNFGASPFVLTPPTGFVLGL